VLIFFIAGLLFAPRARRSLGAYRIPLETGLLIPSGKRGDRPSGIQVSEYAANHDLAMPTAKENRSPGNR
jgi:hypothetical protein